MDLPLHLASGALIGSAVLYAGQHVSPHSSPVRHKVERAAAVFLLGVLSHLLWDAGPHYDWLFYVLVFKPLPYWWLLPQVVVTLPVLFFSLYVMREHKWLALVAMTGGIYPDIEKLFYLDFDLPRYLIIFRKHSCYLTGWRPWELAHKNFLVWFEVLTLFVFMAGIYWINHKRNNRQHLQEEDNQEIQCLQISVS